MRRPAAAAVGIDTGGTFTDFVAIVGGRLVAFKLPSTPRAPERAVLEGLARLGAEAATRVRHGSTVATNTLLERKGARVALLTTAGFEDLLEIGRQSRPDLYALAPRRPEPLVPRRLRIGVRERIGPGGVVWTALAAGERARAVRAVGAARPEAVAVALLHSYAAPRHERMLVRELARLGLPVTASSSLCPEVREYERLSTTVVNAYLAPRVTRYMEGLARARVRLEIVLSHGGTAPPGQAALEPARQLLSGPAAGLEAARAVAEACAFRRALTIDVGGTSTDCAWIAGAIPRRRAREVDGLPILLPMLDVHTVGSGGGSIARVDTSGLLRVGPESAGADPGPACYGKGGPPTVTDALVVLGRIPGVELAGGALPLDLAAAARAMERLARDLGRSDAAAAASGVVALAEARMESSLRAVSVEQGEDPRGSALVAFGGAGGLHACALADALLCRAVIAPRHAGLLSAIGALTGPARRERSRSVLLDARERGPIERELAALEARVRREFPLAERRRLAVERLAEARYRGQSHELTLPAGPGLERRFHAAHRRRFGFADPGREVEVVTLEVRAQTPGLRLPRAAARRGRGASAPAVRARVWAGTRWSECPVFDRERLGPGFRVRGPALVLEAGATLWVAPGWKARTHASGALVLVR